MINGFVLCVLLLFLQTIADGEGQDRESFSKRMEFKSGYNPFRIFGDVPLPPKKSIFRSKLFSSGLYVDIGTVDAVYVRIKVASSLRYNLIKVFGYILHRKQMELNTDYYTALYFILTVIKLNHVDVISLVDVLNSIAFVKPQEQYTKLFEAMEKHLPKYLICAATFWREGIQKKTVDIDKIVMPYNDDTLVVNILEGITPEELKKVSTPDPPEPASDSVEKKILYDFNPNILKVYQILKKRTNVNLFPWAVAGLIHFFPRTLIQPDLEESILVLTQYFYERNISEFKDVNINQQNRGPFELVRTYLQIMITSKDTISIIKDCALTIYRNLKNRSPTAVNPHYASFTYFIQPDSIKVQEMLRYVSKGAFPLEIVLAADRISFYIDQKIIGYFSFAITFNPYLYSTPTEVLIAILDRIIRRQTELSAEVLDSVGAVYSYLIFKYRYIQMPVSYPTDMTRMNVLIMGLKARDISTSMRQNLDSLVSLLIQEHVQYSDILTKKVPIYKCATPIECFTELLITIKHMGIVGDEKIIKLITSITSTIKGGDGILEIEKTDFADDVYPKDRRQRVMNDFTKELAQIETTTSKSSQKETTTTTTTPAPTTTQKPPTTPTEGPIKTASTAAPTSPTTPTAPTPLQTTEVVAPTDALLPVPANKSLLFIIMRNLSETTTDQEKQYAEKMLAIMEKPEFKALIKQAQSEHATIITAYLSMLHVMETEYTQEGFTAYLTKMLAKLTKVKHVLAQMVIEPQFDEPSLYTLSIALPAPTEEEKAKFDLIKAILSKQELFILIKKHIETKELTTVGALLKAVLREEAKLTDKLSAAELEAIKYYISKVQMTGLGNSKITYSFRQEMSTKQVDVGKVMDNALSYDELSRENKKNVNKVIRYLKTMNILQQWTKWHLYSTCGEFTQAMFKFILSMPSLSAEAREAVEALTPKINLDKGGKKPAFHD